MRKFLVVLFLLKFSVVEAVVTVENLVVTQRLGTKLVDITYDLVSETSSPLPVGLEIENDTGMLVSGESCTGDIGSRVVPGAGKSIVWDAEADLDEYIGSLNFRLIKDNRFVQQMALVPGGANAGEDPDFGAYSLMVDTFYMGATEISKILWDDVYQWAVTNGYSFDNAGYATGPDYPVGMVSWYDCVKWCNAFSEMSGRTPCYIDQGRIYRSGQRPASYSPDATGYRLPTRDEWEYAARGGLIGKRFP